jgi:hypothetical protein
LPCVTSVEPKRLRALASVKSRLNTPKCVRSSRLRPPGCPARVRPAERVIDRFPRGRARNRSRARSALQSEHRRIEHVVAALPVDVVLGGRAATR